MADPEKPKAQLPSIKDFEIWVAGRTGLTLREFFDIWVGSYELTPAQRESLWAQVKKPPPKPPPERPPQKPPEKPPEQPKKKPELIIDRIPYPKWWRDSLNATISLTAPGSSILAKVSGKLRLFVSTIVLTVTGETVITIRFGEAGSSGPIYLGGTDQPMGMVVAMGNSPAPCGGGSLKISATDPGGSTPTIGGWATCFAMPEKEEELKVKNVGPDKA